MGKKTQIPVYQKLWYLKYFVYIQPKSLSLIVTFCRTSFFELFSNCSKYHLHQRLYQSLWMISSYLYNLKWTDNNVHHWMMNILICQNCIRFAYEFPLDSTGKTALHVFVLTDSSTTSLLDNVTCLVQIVCYQE